MKILLILPLFLLLSLLSSPGWSADYDKGVTAFENGDFATALREWTPLAEQGDARARFALGVMYRDGKGVLQDYKTAVNWFTRAAEQGHVLAQRHLGWLYRDGKGVLQDNIYAHMWLSISALPPHDPDGYMQENIDIVAGKMTSAEISAAEKRARDCIARNYKGC